MFTSEQIEQIAQICHATNLAFCRSIGDHSQNSWDFAAEWQRQSAISGVLFHLGELEAGHKADPEASHLSWLKEKVRDGWKYGPVKDVVSKEHPCMVPYAELPAQQQLKDYLFCAVVTAFYEHSLASTDGVPESVLDLMSQGSGGHWFVAEIHNGERYTGRPATEREIAAYRKREEALREKAGEAVDNAECMNEAAAEVTGVSPEPYSEPAPELP